MHSIVCGVAALSVAGIFYTYRFYQDLIHQKQRMLRERVAFMLWVMAAGVQD